MEDPKQNYAPFEKRSLNKGQWKADLIRITKENQVRCLICSKFSEGCKTRNPIMMLLNGRKRDSRRSNLSETLLNSSKVDLGKQSSRHRREEKRVRARLELVDFQASSRFQTQDNLRDHKQFNVWIGWPIKRSRTEEVIRYQRILIFLLKEKYCTEERSGWHKQTTL